ncbi:MAG: gliding motility-associated C-terminal domain-containing protein [Bacteroidales bacterium]|nr:gliding motility-associated C-terminal domain-containing protein [Bacteroidales bacterium]MCF8388888.1 gliding motility-associated C-terminal domain-containing protein [Bacteroidales bacterium]MCF8397023.1 gliding motility-associated C-terminal domain-containing protein [Bacteroidales bacterium]
MVYHNGTNRWNIGFVITPNNYADDYDWAVYDLTNARCEDIYNQVAQLQVSCNYSGDDGPTGPNGQGSSNCHGAGPGAFNALIPVSEGETYVINISNFSSTQYGYTLDFTPSTAQVYDNVRPEINHVYGEDVICGSEQVDIIFTEKVQCETISADDFQIFGPNGEHEVTDVYGSTCALGGEMENRYSLTVDPPFTNSGDYDLKIKLFSGIKDACENVALAMTYPFTLDLNAPEVDDSGMEISPATCGQSNGSITGLQVSGNGPFAYEWQDSDGTVVGTELDLTGVLAGEYILYIADPNGCEGIGGPYTVQNEGAPEVDENNLSISANECNQTNGSITGLVITGSEPFTFTWLDEDDNVVGSDLDITGLPGGVYTLEIVDANDCESFAGPYTVDSFPAPDVFDDNIDIAEAHCDQADGSITGMDVLGTEPLEYTWYDDQGNVVSSEIDLLDVVAGSYTFEASDEIGCMTETGPYVIENIGGPELDQDNVLIENASCLEENASISGILVSAASPYEVEWLDENSNVVGTDDDLSGIGPGSYTMVVTDEAGCESLAGPFTVENVGGVVIEDFIFNDATCQLDNGYVEINTTGGYGNKSFSADSVNWQSNSVFETLSPGIYHFYVRDDYGCVTAYEGNPVELTNVGDSVHAEILGTPEICSGEDLQLEADNNGTFDFNWWGPSGFQSNDRTVVLNDVQPANSGLYAVEVTNPEDDCSDTAYLDVYVIESFAIQADVTASKTEVYPGESITFTAHPVGNGTNPVFEWRINDVVFQSGSDSVFITSEIISNSTVTCWMYVDESCAYPNPVESNEVEIKVVDVIFYLPNSFKPGSQRGNDVFTVITNLEVIPDYKMLIYSKWGQVIFESDDMDQGWDGMIDGKPAPAGVYVWTVNYTVYSDNSGQGEEKIRKGTVTLVR